MSEDFINSDNLSVSQITKGDQQAFETVYHRYWHSLLNVAYKRIDNRQQSEDLVQNIFLRLWKNRQNLHITNLAAYLHTAMRYEVLNFVTRNKTASTFYEPFELLLADSETADAKLLTSGTMNLVYAYADTLPAKRKLIFLLHIESRLTTKEIAEQLDITRKTVQNQLNIALSDLRKRLIPGLLIVLASFLYR